jgi:hypothetical protein
MVCSDAAAAAEWEAQGGIEPYSFSIVGGANAQSLSPGEYTAFITDANGCAAQDNFTVGAYPLVSFIASNDTVCEDDVASLQYFGFGGALPYNYDWQGQNPNALTAGIYMFTLTDGNGCTDQVEVEVANFPVLEVAISDILNANGGDNGSIALSINGGEPPYSILWNTGDTEVILDSIGPGIYSVIVTDANGCSGTSSQNIIDLGVQELTGNVQLYPNPVESEISLRTNHAGRYEMFDASGVCVLTGRVNFGMNTIDVETLSSGFYTVRIISLGRLESFKVMKR